MALTLTKEVEAPTLDAKLLEDTIKRIYNLHLNIQKKASSFITAVINCGRACNQLDIAMSELDYNGMGKR